MWCTSVVVLLLVLPPCLLADCGGVECPECCCGDQYHARRYCCRCNSVLGPLMGALVSLLVVLFLLAICCFCCPGCPAHRWV